VCELLDAVPEQDLDPVSFHSRHEATAEDLVLDQVVLGVAVRRPVGDGVLGGPAGDIPVEGAFALSAFRCGTGLAVLWRAAAGEVPRAFDRHDAFIIAGMSGLVQPVDSPRGVRFGAKVASSLTVENLSDQEVFVQAGEIVKDGRQDRVLSSGLVLPPKSSPVAIGSLCVENGRWRKRGAEETERRRGEQTRRRRDHVAPLARQGYRADGG
jgi:hypothetical protein